MRPGTEILEKAGGLHVFMNWKRALLMDNGGFQMVSLLKLADSYSTWISYNLYSSGLHAVAISLLSIAKFYTVL